MWGRTLGWHPWPTTSCTARTRTTRALHPSSRRGVCIEAGACRTRTHSTSRDGKPKAWHCLILATWGGKIGLRPGPPKRLRRCLLTVGTLTPWVIAGRSSMTPVSRLIWRRRTRTSWPRCGPRCPAKTSQSMRWVTLVGRTCGPKTLGMSRTTSCGTTPTKTITRTCVPSCPRTTAPRMLRRWWRAM